MNKDLKVDDKVQVIKRSAANKYSNEVDDGIIISIVPAELPRTGNWWGLSPEEQKKRTSFATVQFEDGSQQKFAFDDLYTRDSDLERKFRKESISVRNKINEKLVIATDALDEAQALSEEHGIPFSSSVSPLGQSYIPDSLQTKFPDLDLNFAYDITGTSSEYDNVGWEHSAICN